MAFNRKNGVKLAGVVLSGTLVLAGTVPAGAAQVSGQTQEEAAHRTEEQKEIVVFLNTADSEEQKEKGSSDKQAVHSLEEALAALGTGEEEPEVKKYEGKRLLVLCGGTELSEEETALLAEKGIRLLSESDYQSFLTAEKKEESPKKEEENSGDNEAEDEEPAAGENVSAADAAEGKQTEAAAVEAVAAETAEEPQTENLPGADVSEEQEENQTEQPFLWQSPEIAVSVSEDTAGLFPGVTADSRENTESEADDFAAESEASKTVESLIFNPELNTGKESASAGILLPGFSIPTGSFETEDTDRDMSDTEEGLFEETISSDLNGEIQEDQVVYSMFSMFRTDVPLQLLEAEQPAAAEEADLLSETADAEETNPLTDTADTEESPEPTDASDTEAPMILFSLAGTDLVGRGTSGVGSGSSTSSGNSTGGSGKGSSTGKTSSGSSTGKTSTGNSTAGSSSVSTGSSGIASGTGNSAGSAGTAASSASAQPFAPAAKGIVQTGDSSHRTLWGLTAGMSGILAAFFAAQWRKFRRDF